MKMPALLPPSRRRPRDFLDLWKMISRLSGLSKMRGMAEMFAFVFSRLVEVAYVSTKMRSRTG